MAMATSIVNYVWINSDFGHDNLGTVHLEKDAIGISLELQSV